MPVLTPSSSTPATPRACRACRDPLPHGISFANTDTCSHSGREGTVKVGRASRKVYGMQSMQGQPGDRPSRIGVQRVMGRTHGQTCGCRTDVGRIFATGTSRHIFFGSPPLNTIKNKSRVIIFFRRGPRQKITNQDLNKGAIPAKRTPPGLFREHVGEARGAPSPPLNLARRVSVDIRWVHGVHGVYATPEIRSAGSVLKISCMLLCDGDGAVRVRRATLQKHPHWQDVRAQSDTHYILT